jgi:enterobactin synthetase component F
MIDSSLFIARNVVSPLSGAEEVRAALSFLNIQLSEEHTAKSLKELGEFLFQPDNARLIPQVQGIMKVAKQVAKSKPEFVNHLLEVMLNNLKVARQYSPRTIDTDLLYFHASQVTGNLEGILERSPSAWRPFINGQIEIHELQCHHEEVLDLIPAAQIGSILRKRLSRPAGMSTEITSAVIPGEAEAISGAWA